MHRIRIQVMSAGILGRRLPLTRRRLQVREPLLLKRC